VHGDPPEALAHDLDLAAGSGLSFDDRGEQTLKGVPGTWHVYAAHA